MQKEVTEKARARSAEVDRRVASMELAFMGKEIDTLTDRQRPIWPAEAAMELAAQIVGFCGTAGCSSPTSRTRKTASCCFRF